MTAEDTFHLGLKALIRNPAGQVLVFQVNIAELTGETRSYWDLPGGRINRGENLEQALRREIAEETGLSNVKIGRHLGMGLSGIRIPQPQGDVGLILSLYECETGPDPQIAMSSEHVRYDWVAPQRAAELLGVKFPAELTTTIAGLTAARQKP